MATKFLHRDQFQVLLDVLKKNGYAIVGPQMKNDAIVYTDLQSVSQFPKGVEDKQSPGKYRLINNKNTRWFSWANGPQGIKPILFPSRENLWKAVRNDKNEIQFRQDEPEVKKTAVVGVRACDLAALQLHDQHFISGEYKDPYYSSRRKNIFLIAVNCTTPAQTCFCVSTGDGPEASAGFDIALTELDDGFVVYTGSGQGREILNELDLAIANKQQLDDAQHQIEQGKAKQKRTLPGRNLRDILFSRAEDSGWEDVAGRCLSCGNCTSVCPTCFCHSEHEEVSLNVNEVSHYRQWSSCFTQEHSYMHGIVIREEIKSRYRQWLTHKLGSWHDQYGRSGCVGCGRCISWCPAGIDITQEVHKICGEADA